jgi:putative (di)nucleoside polyphosphate hydrolase
MRFQGADADINIATEHAEFSDWRWVGLENLPDLVVSFKRKLYLDLLQELRRSGAVWHLGPPSSSGQ